MKKINILILIASFSSINGFADELDLPNYPLQTTGFVEPNVLFLIDNSGSMDTKDSPATSSLSRLDIAKKVAVDIVKETPEVRFCLGAFNSPRSDDPAKGGRIVTECQLPTIDPNTSKTYIEQAINSLSPDSWTPLAEAYYEMVGYFKNGKSFYNTNVVGRVSPIEYRCQKNYAIVLTDGVPFFDTEFPGLDAQVPGRTIRYGDYDNVANDGNLYNGDYYQRYLFLDDIAKFAYDTDLRDGGENDAAGKSFNDVLFPQQNLHTYTVGFTLNDANALKMLEDAAEKEGYGHGQYYSASNYEELKSSFGKALTKITDTSQSVAAASANTGELIANSKLYQSRYTAKDWTGELIALDIDTTTYQVSNTPAWSAPVALNVSQRIIYTGHSNGSLFNEGNFSGSEISSLFGDIDIISYIRGNDFTKFRDRTLPMGDVINSSPIYLAPPTENAYQDDDFSQDYSVFYNSHKDRQPMIYLGANDGMMHGFNANNGQEKVAFIPSKVLPNLKHLADKNYTHLFYVDGSPTVETVYSAGEWRSLLVGGLGRGGQGIYALDVTEDYFNNTETDARSVFQWEFSDTDDADLGYTYSSPQIMRLNDGNFYVVVSSGYNNTTNLNGDSHISSTGNAVVYLLNVATGVIEHKISTGVGKAESIGRDMANGMGEPAGIDTNNDGKIDYMYAGDLFGNLWKFDLSSSDTNTWGADDDANDDNNPSLLFSAVDGTGKAQSITAPLEVVKLPNKDVMIFFGTGKYLEEQDTVAATISAQSFYGIKDTGDPITDRTQLLEQKVIYDGDITFTTDQDEEVNREVRIISNNKYSGIQKGWFIDLQSPIYTHSNVVTNIEDGVTYELKGEQVIVRAVYRDSNDGYTDLGDGRIFFVTDVPNNADKCLPSSKNYLMSLDANMGARFDYISVDINDDGTIDKGDGITTGEEDSFGTKEYASTSGFEIGSRQAPTFMDILDSQGNKTDEEVLIFSKASVCKTGGSNCSYANTMKGKRYKASGTGKRTSWRELRAN